MPRPASTTTNGSKRAKHDPVAHHAVYSQIRTALLAGRFVAGQKLQEPAIARVLGTSRERVRGALRQLAFERLLTLTPNRGAYVPDPSLEEITEVVEARIAVESWVVRLLAAAPDKFDLSKLDRHVAKEATASRRKQRDRQIVLSAGFHLLLCEIAGNRFVLGFETHVIGISQLYYSLYGPPEYPHCGGPSEHPAILKAIRTGQGERAVRLMAGHLRESLKYTMQRKAEAASQGSKAGFPPMPKLPAFGERRI